MPVAAVYDRRNYKNGAHRAPLQSCHCIGEVIRQRCLENFPLAGARMPKAKLPGMQHLPREFLRELWRINFVAQHGVTEMMKMHADLVGPAAVQSALNQTHFGRGANDAILRYGRAPS